MKGVVMKSTGSWYVVLNENKEKVMCRLRGKMRLDESKETNPVAVGDYVEIDQEQNDSVITTVLPRKNHILRQSVKKTGHTHVLAANIDQVLIMATLKQPRTSLGFIDRFLVTAEAYQIPQIVLFNKMDLMDAEEREEINNVLAVYDSLQVTALALSATQDQNFDKLKALLKGKTTLVAGHSGVGKSTLFNRLSPHHEQTTGNISSFSAKGTHTTTFAEMFQMDEIDENTFIIDTPGVKEWGLADMNQQEISDYFPEMRELRLSCKFGSRCLHLHEPKCAVLDAVEKGIIAASRYDSYVSMVMGDDNRK